VRTQDVRPPRQPYRVGAHPSPWEGPLAALDILLNNLGVGLFLIVAIGDLVAHDTFADLAGIAVPVAFVIIALDLLLLVVDLGDPFRFFHMLRVIKPRTPMSVGVWSLSLVMILLLPVVLISVIGWFTDVSSGLETVATVFVGLAIVPAFGALAYKGVLFSITAQPGWRDARWLGSYVCTSGLALGSSVLLLIAVVAGSTEAVRPLRTATLVLVALSAVTLVLVHGDIRSEWRLRSTPRHRRSLGAAVLLLGFVVPVTLLAIGTSTVTCGVVVALLVVAGYLLRAELVAIPHAPLHD